MAESQGDKSEKATPTKVTKARKKGDVPRSKDVPLAVGLLTTLSCVTLFFPWYLSLIQEAFNTLPQFAATLEDEGHLIRYLSLHLVILAKIFITLLPVPLAIIFTSLLPDGWIFALGRIKPDLKKMSPVSGIKRLFSAQHAGDVVKMVLKCLLLMGLLCGVLMHYLPEMIALQSAFLRPAIYHGITLLWEILQYFLFALVLFALIDLPLSRFFFQRKLRMSRHEVREEHKNQEGNPQLKQRMRQIQRSFSQGAIRASVPKADVIIANPTHFAVAIKYDVKKAAAPWIVAKGQDEMAQYIRQVAGQHKIEVVTFPPLARALYHSTRVNQQIPVELFRPMAQVLSYVLQLKAWRCGQRDRPTLNTQLHVINEVQHQDG